MKKYFFTVNVYHDDKGFIGYVKSYRKHRNGKYHFTKTKNIAEALKYSNIELTTNIQLKLTESREKLLYNDSLSVILTDQEIRKSKLMILKNITPKYGLFKMKKPIL